MASSTSEASAAKPRPLCSLSLCEDEASAAAELVREKMRSELGVNPETTSTAISKRRGSNTASSSSTARALISRTPGRELSSVARSKGCGRVFGRPIRDLSMVYVDLDEKKEVDASDCGTAVSAKTSVLVPKIVAVICSELYRRHLGQEGLFRKSGSSLRQKQLRDALECASPEAWVNIVRGNSTSGGGSDVVVSGLDLAALLKQWLRELPEPLIPRKFQLLFIDCFKRFPETSPQRVESLVLSTCLLPTNNAATLIYLSRFFAAVAERSDENKMDLSNLAIVLAPTMFAVADEAGADSGSGGSKSTTTTPSAKKKNHAVTQFCSQHIDLLHKTDIVRMLLRNSYSIGILPNDVEEVISQMQSSDVNGSFLAPSAVTAQQEPDYENIAVGPMERRNRKKKQQKRRSASLSRVGSVFTATVKGIQKAMSRSTTPTRYATFGPNESTAASSFHCTPLPTHRRASSTSAAPFTSPRLPKAKRKASVVAHAHESSPNPEQLRKMPPAASSTDAHTPQVRGRSFSVKKKFNSKQKLDAEDSSGAAVRPTQSSSSSIPSPPSAAMQLLSFSPLPSKPSLDLVTPATPSDLPMDVADSKTPKTPDETFGETISSRGSSSTAAARRAPRPKSHSPTDQQQSRQSRPASRNSSMRQPGGERRMRSPSERKIGIVRRRSQEMQARIERQQRQQQSPASSVRTSKPSLTNAHLLEMRSQLSMKPAPPATSKPTPIKAVPKAARSTSSGAINSSESLTNLKHDISSFIEKSFGASQDECDGGKSSFDNLSNSSVGDIVKKLERSDIDNDSSLYSNSSFVADRTRMSTFRRQSSACEFKTTSAAAFDGNAILRGRQRPSLRRQSSAFEVAERNRPKPVQPVYENLNRGTAARGSLKRRNSSVKDLIKKLERPKTMTTMGATAAKRPSPPRKTRDEEAAAAETDEEWVDAEAFFKNPLPPPPPPPAMAKTPMGGNKRASAVPHHMQQHHQAFEGLDSAGCKRDSIIRIRQENRGKVSKSIETFTKPQNPPSLQGKTTIASSSGSSRRLSARMGISPVRQSAAGSAKANTNKAPLATPRRQTLTGIRTSYKSPHYENVKSNPVASRRKSTNLTAQNRAATPGNNRTKKETTMTDENAMVLMRTPTSSAGRMKKSSAATELTTSRRKSKRFMTIGYEGEAALGRSPLAERQNIVVTVQRSKSAQTPIGKTAVVVKRDVRQNENSPSALILDHPMVRRSMSLKVATPDKIEVPPELRDTIYDVTTPKSEKVRRHLSDRIVVSSGGSGKSRMRPRPRIKPSAMATTTPGATAVGRRTFVMIGNQQQKNSIPVRAPIIRAPIVTHNAY